MIDTLFSFNRICKQHLNQGFQKVERVQVQYLKGLKGKLPRRESARRHHKYSRHCDILTAIDTRMNLLSMTFGKYIDASLCCFIPGKIIDEIYNVLRILKESKEPPRTYEVLQELRDISSMAMEHFDEKIVPILIRKHQKAAAATSSSSTPASPVAFNGSHLTPTRLYSSPGAAAFFVAATSTPSGSPTRPGAGSVITHQLLGPHQRVTRDEFLAYKKKMSELLNKHKVTNKKVSFLFVYFQEFTATQASREATKIGRKYIFHIKMFFLQAFRKQNEKIENLQRTVNAQAALISSQTEMLKEINKKLLENEQKLADFLHAKGVTCPKRHLPEDNLDKNDDEDQTQAPPLKKRKI